MQSWPEADDIGICPIYKKRDTTQHTSMRFVDMPDSRRTSREPDSRMTIFENASFIQQEFKITKLELCIYQEKVAKQGPYVLITSIIHTQKDSIEMIYDEGYRGTDALERAGRFLQNLGVSGVILRSTIALREAIANPT